MVKAYGDLMNRLLETVGPPKPEVGMGATTLMWSDRNAGTIVRIIAKSKLGSATRIAWKQDKATRTDDNGQSDSQDYIYEYDDSAPEEIFSLRRSGRWVRQGESDKNGTGLIIGIRDEHYDYGF